MRLYFTVSNLTFVRNESEGINMNIGKKNVAKEYWRPAVLGVSLLFWIAVSCCISALGLSLRSYSQIALSCLVVGAISAFLIWLNIRIRRTDPQSKPAWIRKILRDALPASIICILLLIITASTVSIVSYHPEHIVEKNGYKLVARVHCFPDKYVCYYQYKGPLFYGQAIGYEYYGIGGSDPLLERPIPEPKQWVFYDLSGNVIESGPETETETIQEAQPEIGIRAPDIEVIENRVNELVFTVSIDDYINSFNEIYSKDHGCSYLTPSSEWQCYTYGAAIHSDHKTLYYYFTADEKVWSLPTISVYTPTKGDYIQEITVNFDEHSYTEALYELYEQMCLCTLKVFFPDLSDEKVVDLYSEVSNLGNINMFSSEEWYGSDAVPCALFYKDGIGVYPYFAIGDWARLCIIPVTQETLTEFERKGAEIYEIE